MKAYQIYLLLTALIAVPLALLAQEESAPWSCSFQWDPISFNCAPVVPEESTTDVIEQLAEEQVMVIKALQSKETELQAEELRIGKRQAELKNLEERIERKLDEIRRLSAEIEEQRAARQKKESEDLNQLVKLYETMDPEVAAGFMNNMDRSTAGNLIFLMNPRKAAAIMQALEPEAAIQITEKAAHIKDNQKEAEALN